MNVHVSGRNRKQTECERRLFCPTEVKFKRTNGGALETFISSGCKGFGVRVGVGVRVGGVGAFMDRVGAQMDWSPVPDGPSGYDYKVSKVNMSTMETPLILPGNNQIRKVPVPTLLLPLLLDATPRALAHRQAHLQARPA